MADSTDAAAPWAAAGGGPCGDGAEAPDTTDAVNGGAPDAEGQAYDLMSMLHCRALMGEDVPKPHEVAHLKFVAFSPPDRSSAATEDIAAGGATAGGAAAPSGSPSGAASAAGSASEEGPRRRAPPRMEPAPDVARPGAWWQVVEGEAIIREDSSVFSPEIRREALGAFVQQAAAAERVASGKSRGLVRLPLRPSGWATADASAVGGPRFLTPAPRWRAVFRSGARFGDVLVRRDAARNSEEVAMLRCGDIVEQAGPQEKREGLLRMRVALPDTALPPPEGGAAAPLADVGWVTVDASEAGGPVIFEPA